MTNDAKPIYENHQKQFLEDRLQVYQQTGFWNREDEACWGLLKRDLRWGLDHGIVSRDKNVRNESNERYSSRCVDYWRYWSIDQHIRSTAAA